MNELDQHEFDDELLSAYLDDELSNQERALVESRLAADPAARHALEQLRSVSHSLRDLPTETLGRDLRDSILRRTLESETGGPQVEFPVGQDSDPPSPLAHSFTKTKSDSPLPNVTVGRTMRGWLWASAAIAAAVLIMVLQPGAERNAELPEVARRGKSSAAAPPQASRQLSESQPAQRGDSPSELAKAIPAPPAAPMPAAPPPGFADRERADYPPIAGGEVATVGDPATVESYAATADEAAEEKIAASTAAGAPADASRVAESEPVVVHVLASRAAASSNAFEALLRKNQVDVEPAEPQSALQKIIAARPTRSPAVAPAPPPSADVPTAQIIESEARNELSRIAEARQEGRQSENVEFVLVEAPRHTIVSFLKDLTNDQENFLAISVDDATAADDSRPPAAPPASESLVELRQFNRGIVPSIQETQFGSRFYHDDTPEDISGRHAGTRLQENVPGDNQEEENLAPDTERDPHRGRARRLQLNFANEESQRAPSDGASHGALPTADKYAKQFGAAKVAAAPDTPDPDRMQLLFVIRSSDDEPAPSLKAKNQSE